MYSPFGPFRGATGSPRPMIRIFLQLDGYILHQVVPRYTCLWQSKDPTSQPKMPAGRLVGVEGALQQVLVTPQQVPGICQWVTHGIIKSNHLVAVGGFYQPIRLVSVDTSMGQYTPPVSQEVKGLGLGPNPCIHKAFGSVHLPNVLWQPLTCIKAMVQRYDMLHYLRRFF